MTILHIKHLILREYVGKIVKVIVRKKSNPKNFEKFIDKLYSCGVQDLKIVENFVFRKMKILKLKKLKIQFQF
jgi:hypothetical protein